MKRLFFLSLLSLCAQAQDVQKVQWHGYVSQGLTQSVDSDYLTDNNDFSHHDGSAVQVLQSQGQSQADL